MGNSTYKVLCFTDNDTGRDVEMVLPLRYFAERFLNCKFTHAFVYDVFAVYRIKPDIVLLPNTVGSPLYFEISKYAVSQNIPVFALVSEGNFRTDGTFNYWGYNVDKKFYQEYLCLWSQRTLQFMRKELPEFADKLVCTGGTGFDRYNIYEFMSKEEFFDKRKIKRYNKIIGYAGWAFGKLYNKQGLEELLYYFKNDNSRLEWLKKQREEVEEILRKAIENNPDTLFILKKHPNEENPSILTEGLNEMNRLLGYENVLYVKNDENIHDLISISDFWVSFESTTALEAWIMGKQTLLINPDPEWARDELYRGAVIVRDYETFQKLIDGFYKTGKIEGFDDKEKEQNRIKIIKDTIGAGDGFNHIRAAYYFKKTIDIARERQIQSKFSLKYFIMYALMHIGKYFYNKKVFENLYKFKKTVWIFERFRLTQIPVLYQKYSKQLDAFYRKNNIQVKFEKNQLFSELIEKEKVSY